jgi:hypothetical protein
MLPFTSVLSYCASQANTDGAPLLVSTVPAGRQRTTPHQRITVPPVLGYRGTRERSAPVPQGVGTDAQLSAPRAPQASRRMTTPAESRVSEQRLDRGT